MYTPKNLKKWTMPKYYYGEEWKEYYVFLGRNRDSDNLDNSNFEMGLKNLGGESDTVIKVCESHWLCGWVEWIAINESDESALQLADEMKDNLNNYPVLNDEDYSEREYNDYMQDVTQAVKDYINDHNLDITDNQQSLIENHIMQNSNDDSCPTEEDIESAYDAIVTKHTKYCST